MTSDFQDIFGRFYTRVKDYKIPGLEQNVVDALLGEYIKSVVADPLVRRQFTTVYIDEDVGEIEYEMRKSIDDSFDQNYLEELLTRGMIVQWLKPQYYSMENTLQLISNSDQKYYSQANHMAELKAMLDRADTDFRKYIRDSGYSNAIINGVT